MPANRPLAYIGAAFLGAVAGGLVVLDLCLRWLAAPPTPFPVPPAPVAAGPAAVALSPRERTLQAEVDLLKRQLGESRDRVMRLESLPPGTTLPREADPLPGPDVEALAKIQLPPNPTREQAAQYLRQVLKASQVQRTYSDADPQVEMIARVGREHLDVLLASDDMRYVPKAVESLVTDADKDRVIAALRRNVHLFPVVRRRGWERDAHAVLVEGMRGRTDYLPTEWVDAVAGSGDPAAYPLVREYLARGMNPSWTYKSAARIPGVDLDEWVRYAWSRRRPGGFRLSLLTDPTAAIDFAPTAAAHGHADALAYMFRVLGDRSADEWRRRSARDAVVALTDAQGTDADLAGWYEQNNGRLVWDGPTKRYVVRADTQPSTLPAVP